MEALLDQAEGLLTSKDYQGAASAAEKALDGFKLSVLSRTAVVRGKALMGPLMAQIMDSEQDDPDEGAFEEAWVMFMLALRFEPENEEAQSEIDKIQELRRELPAAEKPVPPPDHPEPLDVIVVGAGASGVGVGLMLTRTFDLDRQRVLLVERGTGVGETFRRWPREMRFISPSFNQQGWTKSFDLNSVAYGTSPAFTLHAEHPTGEQYADYLCALAEQAELHVQTLTDVTAVRPFENGFEVEVQVAGAAPTLLRSRYVVWAAGEFQYPRVSGSLFPGSEHCIHNSSVNSWGELPGDNFVVIGGFESGMDAASNLSLCGKRCTVVSSTAYWNVATEDPSTELAPYTAERVRKACASPTPPRLLAPLRVFAVEALKDSDNDGGFTVRARWLSTEQPGIPNSELTYRTPVQTDTESDTAEGTEISLHTLQAPLLCAGFEGSVILGAVKDLFDWGGAGEESEEEPREAEEEPAGEEVAVAEEEGQQVDTTLPMSSEGDEKGSDGCAEGAPLLNKYDESTKTPGLFLVGPAVRHGALSFCFVYKFRQRFGIVAEAIARGLGRDTDEAVEAAREMNMFMDDFECCADMACGESC